MEDRTTVALKEYEFLQNIIARQESIRLTIRNWLFGLVTGLIIAFYSNDFILSQWQFTLLSIFLILMFYWTELLHRVAEYRAMVRSTEVEEILRSGTSYDGPKIGKSLDKRNTIKDQIAQIPNNPRIYIPYITLLFIISLIALVGK
ncbi:MAG TPA: hypothetical protein DEG92_06430 [Rikenellaceae bacterium]|nr:hypothetical protein [Rikenellaceae bacterium]